MASIVVTHDLHSAKTIADRLALLNKGNVVIEGSFEELQKSDIEFVSEFLKAFVGGHMSRAARLGAFIVVTLAILVLGVFIIGSKQYLFSSTYQLKAQFDNVVGLDAGGDVRVGGVHSGTVRNIVLPHKPGEKVTVIMDLGKSTHEIIKQDSVATIETEGLLGNQFLAISFGSDGSGDVRDGDIIASQPPLEMSDLLQKTSGILDSSQQAIQNATRATANLDSISAKIDRGQGTAGALVNDKAAL